MHRRFSCNLLIFSNKARISNSNLLHADVPFLDADVNNLTAESDVARMVLHG